ncbi:MAG: S41 family peptidase [Planctomycetota bacterium]|jgi:C-terminal processing protease CtpA/Prc
MRVAVSVLALVALLALASAKEETPKQLCVKDVVFAVKEVEDKCKIVLATKRIKWKNQVAPKLVAEARKAETLEDHYEVLVKLIARLRDGHAGVMKKGAASKLEWPGPDLDASPGISLCRAGKKIFVRAASEAARAAKVLPGMEVVKIDGKRPAKWLDARRDELCVHWSFSTKHQADYFACHAGLGGAEGTKITLELKSGKTASSVTLERKKGNAAPRGPIAPPAGLEHAGACHYGKTERGFGYVWVSSVTGGLPGDMDKALGAIGNPPGVILDFRANGGGSTNHDALLGQFVMKDQEFERSKAYPLKSVGDHPYGGPVVVIVDAGVCSAGETASGMFKEDGRGYLIGETPTAGMSSKKLTIELPSGLFSLYVSYFSNKARFQGGAGIEGIGIVPHETVPYDAKDLAAGRDTLLLRAEALLRKDLPGKVPYRPKQRGWKPD